MSALLAAVFMVSFTTLVIQESRVRLDRMAAASIPEKRAVIWRRLMMVTAMYASPALLFAVGLSTAVAGPSQPVWWPPAFALVLITLSWRLRYVRGGYPERTARRMLATGGWVSLVGLPLLLVVRPDEWVAIAEIGVCVITIIILALLGGTPPEVEDVPQAPVPPPPNSQDVVDNHLEDTQKTVQPESVAPSAWMQRSYSDTSVGRVTRLRLDHPRSQLWTLPLIHAAIASLMAAFVAAFALNFGAETNAALLAFIGVITLLCTPAVLLFWSSGAWARHVVEVDAESGSVSVEARLGVYERRSGPFRVTIEDVRADEFPPRSGRWTVALRASWSGHSDPTWGALFLLVRLSRPEADWLTDVVQRALSQE